MAPTRLPLCLVLAGGTWVPAQVPLPFVPLQWQPPRQACQHVASSGVELARAFAGRRIIFAGDSLVRAESWTMMRGIHHCPPSKWYDHRFVTDVEKRWGVGFDAAMTEVSARTCDDLVGKELTDHAWTDAIFELRAPAEPGQQQDAVHSFHFETRWHPYIRTVASSEWFRAISDGVADVDAIVVGSYAWYAFDLSNPTFGDVMAEHAAFIAAIDASPRAAYLRDRVVYRTPAVMELPLVPGGSPMQSGALSRAVASACLSAYTAAGMHVLDMTPFSRVSTCVTPEAPEGYCVNNTLTYDGKHQHAFAIVETFPAAMTALAAIMQPRR